MTSPVSGEELLRSRLLRKLPVLLDTWVKSEGSVDALVDMFVAMLHSENFYASFDVESWDHLPMLKPTDGSLYISNISNDIHVYWDGTWTNAERSRLANTALMYPGRLILKIRKES